MSIIYPDYQNSIANLACSVLKEFHAEYPNRTLELADRLFQRKYKNIVLLLLDGMGQSILKQNLSGEGFFASHLVGTYSSVFPPTTVAATTSVDSGLFPVQHSWLGWDCYYKELDQNVTVYLNTVSGTDMQAADFPVARTYCPYTRISDRIRAAGYQAYDATPFAAPYPQTFEEICGRIDALCKREGRKYIYGYWTEPDHIMHEKGCDASEAKRVLCALEDKVEKLCAGLQDTLLLVTADHGHINSRGVCITEYPRIMECLIRLPSIEPRALNLFVKKGMESQLEAEFTKEFGDHFLLLRREQVKEMNLFGTGSQHPRFDEMLGDYIAVATSDLSIYNTPEEKEKFIGVHAGFTQEEMIIPLIAAECL